MKKNILNIVLIVIMVFSVVFHFLVTQTDYIQQIFKIKLNQKQVVVSTTTITKGESISDKLTVKYINSDCVLENAFTDIKQIKKNALAKQTIYQGEQIIADKIDSETNIYNPKKLMYAISASNLNTIGTFLYAGDKVSLWRSWNSETGKKTDKVFELPVEIIALKDSNGNLVNYDRTRPTTIPSSIIIRVDEEDICKLEKFVSQPENKFFFVKEII